MSSSARLPLADAQRHNIRSQRGRHRGATNEDSKQRGADAAKSLMRLVVEREFVHREFSTDCFPGFTSI
jgi:hypothetical protein